MPSLKPYPAYKNSAVPWLGEVPEHWEVHPNRALFAEVKDQNHPEEPLLSVTITRGVIPQDRLLTETSKKDSSNLDKSKYKLVQTGDIAYNKMRAWQGAIGASNHRGIVSPAYIVQRPRPGLSAEYVHHLLRTPAFAKEAERWSYGISSDQWSLRAEHFKMIYSVRPPIEEQTAIVRFLGHVDRKIQRVIRAKQKLIKLLEEEKQVLIHRAVTGQIDVRTGKPYPAYKPSGVEWLGDVPEHWEVAPLRRRWEVRDCKHLTVPFVEDGIPLISVREAQHFDLDPSSAKRTTLDWYKKLIDGGRKPQRGDLIYCRNVGVGAATFVDSDEQLAMGQDVCLIRSRAQNQRYLNYFLHSPAMQNQLSIILIGSTFDRINVASIKALLVVVPPKAEQDAIAVHLDELLTGLEGATASIKVQISLLREYRTRLVADVVTGKLDVREAAANLPAEPEAEMEAPEPEDDLDLPQAAEEEGSYDGGQEED